MWLVYNAVHQTVRLLGVRWGYALGPPVASSLAERAGLQAGDWVRAYSTDGVEWHDLSSMTDLRWQLMQATMHGESLSVMSPASTVICMRRRSPLLLLSAPSNARRIIWRPYGAGKSPHRPAKPDAHEPILHRG